MKIRKSFGLVVLAAMLCAACPALAVEYAPGEAIVVFRVSDGADVTASSLADKENELSVSVATAIAAVGAEEADIYEALSEAEGKVFVRVKSTTKNTEELIAALRQRPDVIAVSPNRIRRMPVSPSKGQAQTKPTDVNIAAERTPKDPDYNELWGMKKIHAPEVWAETVGSETIYAAVMDTGVYGQHEDLKDNIASEFGFSAVSGALWSEDLNGHGTHVAGTIGAVGNNGIGVTGVNWHVKIIPVCIATPDGELTDDGILSGLNYLTSLLQAHPDMKLAAVNMSFGGYQDIYPEEMQEEAYYLAFQTFDRLNRTLMIVAAGNNGLEVGSRVPFDEPILFQIMDERTEPAFTSGDYVYPASFTGLNNMIVVGATASDDSAASFTNWGQSVDIAAPGDEIYSTYSPIASGDEGNFYKMDSGTSMAAPHVTGAAALLLSAYPNATPAQLKRAILNGADSSINPKVYPYRNFFESTQQQIEEMHENGEIDQLNYVALFAFLSEAREAYSTLYGAGMVSRVGMLNLKGALNVLSDEMTASSSNSGSGGGCNMGLAALGLAALLPALIIRRRSR